MKDFNNAKIIGIDHGYGNIKTANCCFGTGILASDKEPVFKENMLVWNNRYYLIGEGHKEFSADKMLDEDYYVLTLAAIARELNIQYFSCSNNNSRNRTCPTTHYIRTSFLEEIVLCDINRVIAFTNQYKDDFLQILMNSSGMEMQKQISTAQSEIEKLQNRNSEIDCLFNAVYEDKIKGIVTEERFHRMTQSYETEQSENKRRMQELSEQLKSRADKIDTAKLFLNIIDKTTHLEVLTANIVREFIDKIVVHHRTRLNGVDTQKVEIFYNVIGKFEIPPDLIPKEPVTLDTRQGVTLALDAKETA